VRAVPAALAAAAALALVPVATAAKPGKSYAGSTSIKTKVGFRLGTTQVTGFAIGYVATCDDGETLRGTYRFKPAKVKEGRFGIRGPSSGTLPDGRTTASNLRLTGRLGSGRARGTFAIVTQMAAPSGAGVATCRSARVTWRAAPRRAS
jgi:hypothetical protein